MPVSVKPLNPREYSVSIIIPCRNERGNIEAVVTRMPALSSCQELIFVEGHSGDGTYQEIERVMSAHPEKDMQLFRQEGDGKGDAVRLGFAKAKGEILIIFDADVTVIPESLPEFYAALRDQRGEFVYGSRLALPMEKGAMPRLNFLGNTLSALFFSWLLSRRFTDTLCGVKAMFRADYQRLVEAAQDIMPLDPWGDFSLILGAFQLNLRILEIPVAYKSRQYGMSQIKRFQDTLRLLRLCVSAIWVLKFRGPRPLRSIL